MKVSICIPTYNRPDLLQQALESCFSQTYLPTEIVIGDDSKDNRSKILVESLIEKVNNINIRYYNHNPSLGQLANVNKLIEYASSECDKFVLLHDDDLLLPNALEDMVRCFESDATINVVYGKQYMINEDGESEQFDADAMNEYFYRSAKYEGSLMTSLEAGMVQQFPNDCYMVDMEVVKKIKYGTKEQVGNAGDFDFGFRLGIAGYKFHYLDKFTAKYRITHNSVARSGTDSGYQAYKRILGVDYLQSGEFNYKRHALREKAPVAIYQALQKNHISEAVNIYFSPYHRHQILSLGGAKRLMLIIKHSFFKLIKAQ